MSTLYPNALPSVTEQAQRLIHLGVPTLLEVGEDDLRSAAATLEPLAVGPCLLVPSRIPCTYADLMALVELDGKSGFVVEDFTDASSFEVFDTAEPTATQLPQGWYLLEDPRRGDEFSNASPAEALQQIVADRRIPLTMIEGIFWALQSPPTNAGPGLLERNHCFMTIGSRKRKKAGFDARTPALWISNGTGRDTAANKNAAKLGWCWWNNRHTWLGIAHAARRTE